MAIKDNTRQDNPIQDIIIPNKARQINTRQCKRWSGKTRQDKTRQINTIQDKTRQH